MPADALFNMVSDYDGQQFFFSPAFNGYCPASLLSWDGPVQVCFGAAAI